ncbi:hypothetical protein AB1Y20_013974 [Prymnesium parvum]|uniref:Structural maintenance of chromosomes protein 5 n=1 Tax=Prymnesium parvum TaxID=97485 RepID=A0AB34IH05_PRYPA
MEEGSGVKVKRQRVDAVDSSRRGQIARITLHNFMSYTDAEISEPGERLNCIIGPNGTGKSSIVCAMCVGLGGPLKVTERGDKISACVHGEGNSKDRRGKRIERGFVETELVDGNAPGDNLVVRLDFDIHNKEEWKMNGVKVSKAAVREKMQSLNIQVDNPLQFLPQDKVGQFSNLSPVELLKHTEKAIGPETYAQHQELIAADKARAGVAQTVQTEQKVLDDELEKQRRLQKDVDRWQQYEANIEKLRQLRGKRKWVRYNAQEAAASAKADEFENQKNVCAQLNVRIKEAEKEEEPLKQLGQNLQQKAKVMKDKFKDMDAKRAALGKELSQMEDDESSLTDALEKVDRDLRALEQKRDKLADEVRQRTEDMEAEMKMAVEKFGSNFEEAGKTFEDAITQASVMVDEAGDMCSEHELRKDILERAKKAAQTQLANMSSMVKAKQAKLKKLSPAGFACLEWLQSDPAGRAISAQVVGPLVVDMEVPNKAHRHMMENCVNARYIFGFVAQSETARDKLISKCKEMQWKLNVYRSEGKYAPLHRPDASEMKQWGVTCWADEAIDLPAGKRDPILCLLKDMAGIDRALLATDKALEHREKIHQFLRENGIPNFRLYTPTMRVGFDVSQYGQRQTHMVTNQLLKASNVFNSSGDESQKAKLEEDLRMANANLEEHAKKSEELKANKKAAEAELKRKKESYQQYTTCRNSISRLEKMIATKKSALSKLEAEVEQFDVEEKKAERSKDLQDLMERQLCKAAEVTKWLTEMTATRVSRSAALIAQQVAIDELEVIKDRNKQLKSDYDNAVKMKETLKTASRDAKNQLDGLRKAAMTAAPEFDPSNRDEASEAVWQSLPSAEQQLDAEIAFLVDETEGSTADSSALEDYKKRQKKIEEIRARLEDITQTMDEKRSKVERLREMWKPKLQQMVAQVNDNFSEYFGRLKCFGEVHLVDGRKLNDAGEPDGPDDFSQYKIHIKVRWRENEQLHVLGEGGRDSGGERSVATMIYLISLQSINPAPFRVVDEINQAMDSTNERHVFECVTHACSTGGKQYFLLTPKLLPDLPYGEETSVQVVFNGPWMEDKDKFNLKSFC